VTPVTALGDAICFCGHEEGEADMTKTRTFDDLLGQVPMIDERNEQPLVVALFAIVVAWLALFVVTVA
jgi:hypothetical protein